MKCVVTIGCVSCPTHLALIMCSQSPSSFTPAKAANQSPWYKQQLKEFTCTSKAMSMVKGEVEQVELDLEAEEITKPVLLEALLKLPAWADTLRAAVLLGVYEKLQGAWTRYRAARMVQITEIENMSAGAQKALITELVELQQSVQKMQPMAGKFPLLSSMKLELEEMIASAEKAKAAHVWVTVIEPFVEADYQSDADAEEALIEIMSTDELDSAVLDAELGGSIHKAFLQLAHRVAVWTEGPEAKENMAEEEVTVTHIVKLTTTMQKVHRLLGSLGDKSSRQFLFKLILPPLQLRRQLLELAKAGADQLADLPTEAFMQKIVHFKSVQLRGKEALQFNDDGSEEQDELLMRRAKSVSRVVEEGKAFMEKLAKSMQARAEVFEKQALEKGKKLFGESGRKGVGLGLQAEGRGQFCGLVRTGG